MTLAVMKTVDKEKKGGGGLVLHVGDSLRLEYNINKNKIIKQIRKLRLDTTFSKNKS